MLLIEKRSSDFIEDLDDGSILDSIFGMEGVQIKTTYGTMMGVSLFLLVLSGAWLWLGPKIIRRARRSG